MSDSVSIVAVTAALRNLLDQGLNAESSGVSGVEVLTRPLDRVRTDGSGSQVNLFLYHAEPNPAWRNRDVPWRVKSGETAPPPLALNLYYLVTAYYGEAEDGADAHSDPQRLLGSHRLLGRAMSVLHDHPLLDTATIHAALPAQDQLEHPYDQIERVRLTPQPLSLDEMSKLWTGFQTQYRPSMAYQASVVLIESARGMRTPLPVLTRGQEDRGVTTQPGLTPPFPTLESVHPPNDQPSARLGERVTLRGHHLGGDAIARLERLLGEEAIEIEPEAGGTESERQIQLPNTLDAVPAGFYSVSLAFREGGEVVRTTNKLALSLAPTLINIRPNPAARTPSGDVGLKVTCVPEVQPGQSVSLLLGDRLVPALPHPTQTPHLEFEIRSAAAGEHLVRLRVDGVDSLVVNRTVTPPVFDQSQKVRIT